MDPIALILTAITAGAASGLQDSASSAVKSAYEGLKALVKGRLSGSSAGEVALREYETAPGVWERPLTAQLTAAGADRDADLLAAAEKLMSLIDEAGSRAGKYAVNVHGGQGVQVGDNNSQLNYFSSPEGHRTGVRAERSNLSIGRSRIANQDTAMDIVGTDLSIEDSEIT
jgi:hypothetical protein